MDPGTALVTGTGSGIGFATARATVASGFSVMLASLENAPPDMTAGMRYRQSDIADIADHAALLDEAGPLACFVNYAGVTSMVRGDTLRVTPESFDRVLGVNLRGTFFLTQAAARRMLADAAPAGRVRSIVLISSMNVEVVGANRADSCLSNAA